MDQPEVASKLVYTQSGPVRAKVGTRYLVVVRSHEFGNADFEGTLKAIQSLDPNPLGQSHLRVFDFLHFEDVADSVSGGRGARDFTIQRLAEVPS